MESKPNRVEIVGYLQEALPAERMAQIEEHLRVSSEWRRALEEMKDEVDLGEHSVATIWRRHRLTCPTREKLGVYLLGGLVADEEDYVRFHLDVIQCRWCQANLEDVRHSAEQVSEHSPKKSSKRHRKIFESSVAYLPRRK